MDIRLFGPVTVSIDGNPVNVGRPLHKLLVAILASAGGRHVPTDSLIDQMWPLDAPEPRRSRDPRQRLYEVISDVRTALPKAGRNGKTMLSQGDQGYSLSVGRSEVDLLRFHDLWHRADDALERSADKQAVDLYRRAFREWGGDSTFPHRPEPYAGLTGVWVAHQRAQLGQTYRTALVHCAEAELRIGRHGRPVPELLALSADDPGNEQVAALLMRAYYGAGQIHRALEIYAQFRERLVADVGNEPGAPLQELHRRVLNRDPALSLASPPDRANRASEPADSSADTADPRPYQKEEAMDKYVNRAGGHANVGNKRPALLGGGSDLKLGLVVAPAA